MAEQLDRHTLAPAENMDGRAAMPRLPAPFRCKTRAARSSRAGAAGVALRLLRRAAPFVAQHARGAAPDRRYARGRRAGIIPRLHSAQRKLFSCLLDRGFQRFAFTEVALGDAFETEAPAKEIFRMMDLDIILGRPG